MKFGKSLVVAAMCAVMAFSGFTLSAEETRTEVAMRPVKKLGRGIANVAFGVLELPMQWTNVSRDAGNIAGLTWGTLQGVCFVVAREVVGVVDIATFLFPLPGCPNYQDDAGWGYGPIMTPEWVVPVGRDWYNFVYDDTAIVNPVM